MKNNWKLIIDVKGCFWHGHEGCKYTNTPKTNQSQWVPKILKNKKRDIDNHKKLSKLGYKIFTIWECEIKDKPQFINRISEIISLVKKLQIENIK